MIYQLNDEYFVRAIQEGDLDGVYPSWFEDQEVCKYNSHGKFTKNSAYFQSFYDGINSEDRLIWAICHKIDGHIGNISLQNISAINQNAELAILLGDKRHWGKGVSYQSSMKIMEHGFFKLNLNRIYCGTAATNNGMKKLAANLGMMQEGCRRAHLYLDDEWVDVLEFGILKIEFKLKLASDR